MEAIRVQLEQATRLLAGIAQADFSRASDENVRLLVTEIEQLGRLIDAARVVAAGEIDARSARELGTDGLAQRHGFTRGAHLLEHLTRVPQGEANRRARLGSALRRKTSLTGESLPPSFPALASAVLSGDMGVDSARVIVACLSEAADTATHEAIETAERELVARASDEPADIVAIHARVWREALDPDGAAPREDRLRRRRAFHLGRETDGLTNFSGTAEPTFAALLRSALTEGSGPGVAPRFLSDEDRERGTASVTDRDGTVIETLADPRSREQRQYDVLVGLVSAGIRASERRGAVAINSASIGPVAAPITPPVMRPLSTVVAVIQLKDLHSGRGVGWLDDVLEPVSAATIRQLVCDGGVRPIVLGDSGEVLHLGRTQRLFSTAQRRALAVRDGGCVWPGCAAPPGWCQAHHVTEWEHGGATDVDNGALLCSAHHHLLHGSDFTMRMHRGRPQLLAPPWLDASQLWKPLGRTRATMTRAG